VTRALVTGANKGIGLGLSRALAEDGWEVIACCRRSSAELDALGVRVVEEVDVTDPGSGDRIRSAADGDPVDLAAVNAGTNLSFDVDRVDELDLALVEEELRVNAVGAARTALAVLPSLVPGSKVLFVSSGIIGPGRQGSGNFGYTMSKAALNTFARCFAADVRDREIVVAIVTPGMTDTDILRRVHEAARNPLPPGTPTRDPDGSARNLLKILDGATLSTSGAFWAPDGTMIFTPDGVPP
jgi:NAD(P)-dependent dehydrogenase (short-subunit alcohol dehydrogenase family)